MENLKNHLKNHLKIIYFVLGLICLVLGMIGLILPLIPGTPFALLSAYFFSRSSPRVYRWCLSLPFLGEAIRDWETNKVIRPRAKMMAVVFISLGIIILFTFSTLPWPGKIAFTAVLVAVVIFILTRKSGR